MAFEMASLNPSPDQPLLEARTRQRQGDSSRTSRTTMRQSMLRIGEIEGHSGNRPYNILMDLLIFLVTLLEITVVVLLAVTHFKHAHGLTAIAMLLPILLNFVGVIYFLSDPNERNELEKVGCCRCLTDFLQFPILGPVFTAFKVLTISCGCSPHDNYERIEASAIKLRQAGGFFCAAPETLVQLTALLVMNHGTSIVTGIQIGPPEKTAGARSSAVTTIMTVKIESGNAISNLVHGDIMDNWTRYLEIFAVCLFVFTLSESNCYNMLSNYYDMFTDKRRKSWRIGEVLLWQKLVLFLHALSSIGSRMIAMAVLKAAALYRWKTQSFPLVITMVVFLEIGIRLVAHYILRILKYFWLEKEIPSSCYESINYAWRSTILNYGFQSKNILIQVLFYLENVVCFVLWVLSARTFGDEWVKTQLFIPLCIIFSILTGLSMVFLIACSFFELIRFHGPTEKTEYT